MDISVLLAPANNLLMYEQNSGEFIRQLKLRTERTETPLQVVPVQKMPWRSFKKMYPEGEVFLPVNKSFMQKIMDKAIGGTVDSIIDDQKLFYRPMYILDPRLPETERVWGFHGQYHRRLVMGNPTFQAPRGVSGNISITFRYG